MSKPHIQLLIAVLVLLFSSPVMAVQLREGHPNEVIVTKGDTLWDISGRFLQHPWEWPRLWKNNPSIKNPHLIYPGDRLTLTWVNGQPRLVRNGGRRKGSPIGAVSLRELRSFLSRPYLLDDETLENSGYIVGFREGTLIAGPGERAYARHLGFYRYIDGNANSSSTTWTAPPGYAPPPRDDDQLPEGFTIVKSRKTRQKVYVPAASHYDIVRPGAIYKDYESGEVLGRVALFIGTAELIQDADPATIKITTANKEVMQGDRLIASTANQAAKNLYFHPGVPSQQVDGHIIDVPGGVHTAGQYNVVAIDRGASDGIAQGDILLVNTGTRLIKDRFESRTYDDTGFPRDTHAWQRPAVVLPEESAGRILIFRVFDRVSFGLIAKATRSIKTGYPVHSP